MNSWNILGHFMNRGSLTTATGSPWLISQKPLSRTTVPGIGSFRCARLISKKTFCWFWRKAKTLKSYQGTRWASLHEKLPPVFRNVVEKMLSRCENSAWVLRNGPQDACQVTCVQAPSVVLSCARSSSTQDLRTLSIKRSGINLSLLSIWFTAVSNAAF